ncbi:Methyltransferase domain-containing protein [Nocardioides exalbidus]|uniref:Methyltransferase domain-containing protein n=1 Tax=Nocardioides exalbidus TaxID=402596 RepID=A0A1H4XLH3_9ACTN|nr:methyltransferase domain-containing protein [Nocardioides exalbidus]SED06417.1 Methyltransferase domain-containing protein [Nocardioides exalbidus]
MGIGYAAAYRAHLTPWEKASRRQRPVLEVLLDREEADRPDRTRRALDLGCGRGAHTALLVERGWDAMGVDSVRQAVDVAVRRNGLDDARFVVGDVRHLVHSGVGVGFDLFLDVGCFQSLDTAGRAMMADNVTALAAPAATVLVHTSATRARPGWGPQASLEDLQRSYLGWDVAQVADARTVAGTWFRLTRG